MVQCTGKQLSMSVSRKLISPPFVQLKRKLPNKDPFLHKTTEQLTENQFPLCTTPIQEAISYPLKNESN
jgi:hypothetical protein